MGVRVRLRVAELNRSWSMVLTLDGCLAPTLTYATSLRGGSSGLVRAAAMAKDPGAKLEAA
jgi:hypothetical protein